MKSLLCSERIVDCLCWIRIEFAAATLQVVEAVDLAGHFEFAAIDGIMPAFDVDGAFEAVAAEFGDDVRPAAVAEARRTVEGEGLCAVEAIFCKDVATDGGVFSMDVEEAFRPFANLRHRVDELHHLVAGLPLQTDVVQRDGVEHQFPCGGIDGDVETAMLPDAAHVAVFKTDLHAFGGGLFGQRRPDLFEAFDIVRNGLVKTACETAYDVGFEEVGGVDEFTPVFASLVARFVFIHRFAEIEADGGGDDVVLLQDGHDLFGEFGGLAGKAAAEDERKAFEAVGDDLADVVLRVFVDVDQCSESDVLHGESLCFLYLR